MARAEFYCALFIGFLIGIAAFAIYFGSVESDRCKNLGGVYVRGNCFKKELFLGDQ